MTGQGLRRTPVQQRSTERLTRILDACAELLDEGGYESLSTRAVAARAAVPIGSVYRFFCNKRAMADALAHRNLDRYLDRVTARLAEPASAAPGRRRTGGLLSLDLAIDVVVDEYIAMKGVTPGFELVEFGISGEPNHHLADRLLALLAGRLGLDPEDVYTRLTFVISVEAADALIQLAFRTDPSGDPAVIAETKRLLRAYLDRAAD
ncbi:TetR family transcriptional regulator [Streptomyces sp. H10-C2]|uniref:TetR/AcrR family transcriptional regulator n=1 Tax=unclassified Streptomyces TaxID=2593676 RepID=UPI0024BB9FFC|nr:MULTISPECIES: TetR family transcriptional regulator [unclassified Streptomyces]MDJ0343113.1 TetR family transcriptional regulator [Streptomyces sp. PH10-H1]MDJ0371055.1 TetR family transcriptional regulator [Streptomyces sp. H10-C2]